MVPQQSRADEHLRDGAHLGQELPRGVDVGERTLVGADPDQVDARGLHRVLRHRERLVAGADPGPAGVVNPTSSSTRTRPPSTAAAAASTASHGVDVEQDLGRRLGRQGRGDPAQHGRVEDLVGDEQPAHPERVRREQLVAGRHGDAPRPGVQLGGEQLGRHRRLAVRRERETALGGERRQLRDVVHDRVGVQGQHRPGQRPVGERVTSGDELRPRHRGGGPEALGGRAEQQGREAQRHGGLTVATTHPFSSRFRASRSAAVTHRPYAAFTRTCRSA